VLANKLSEFARAVASKAMREGGGAVSMTTTCPKCGRLYEEKSEEEACSPLRLCLQCWKQEHKESKEIDHG
jgi:hypothetical protein